MKSPIARQLIRQLSERAPGTRQSWSAGTCPLVNPRGSAKRRSGPGPAGYAAAGGGAGAGGAGAGGAGVGGRGGITGFAGASHWNA
ncbi:hypothetical protein CGZ97_07030 [Enemella evansiae]|nr:hypothetical protein CGZ97_07030 [Enemella evansiae]